LFRRLLVVIRAWTTRRLLWLWFFAYACVMTSGYLRPVSPTDNYFECPRFLLPSDAVDPATDLTNVRHEPTSFRSIPALIVRPGVGSYAYVFGGGSKHKNNFEAVRGSLTNLPDLATVYVGGYHNPIQFRRLCQELPGIRVWHLDLNGGRLASAAFLLLATLTLGGAVLQQSQALFSLPQSRTFPAYAVPHLLFLAAIGGTGVLAGTLVAGKYGTNFSAAASVQLLAWGTWSAFEFRVLALPNIRWSSRRDAQSVSDPPAPRADWEQGSVGGAVLLAAIAACCVIFVARPYVLESFLLGELPWMTAGVLLVAGVLVSAVVVRMPAFSVVLNETGTSPILSMQDAEKRRFHHSALPTRFERRLGGLRRRSWAPLWLWQVHAMQFGNPDLLAAVLTRIVAPIAVVLLCQWFFPFQLFATAFVVLFLGAGWILSLSHAFSTWWQRRKAFSVQLLYPWTRRQMARAAFAVFALDTVGILAVLYATLVACNVSLGWYAGIDELLRAGVWTAVAGLLVAMGGLWLLTLRHRLLAGFLAVIGILLLMLALTLGGSLVRAGEALATVALLFGLLAWLLGLLAWRRWMRSEWGLYES
jgi:hypothetical protein